MFLQKRGTLGRALFLLKCSLGPQDVNGGPGAAGISTQGKHGSRTHVRETEQKVPKPSQIYET